MSFDERLDGRGGARPMGMVARPVGMVTCPMGTVTRPMGQVARPRGTAGARGSVSMRPMRPAKIPLLLLVTLLGAAAHAQSPAPRPLLVTIDDLPISATRLHSDPAERERITRGMLDVLRKHKVPAVAFVTWDRVLSPADVGLLRLWMDAGHELGNHTLHHLNY